MLHQRLPLMETPQGKGDGGWGGGGGWGGRGEGGEREGGRNEERMSLIITRRGQ